MMTNRNHMAQPLIWMGERAAAEEMAKMIYSLQIAEDGGRPNKEPAVGFV
jgi:hypothetical protein